MKRYFAMLLAVLLALTVLVRIPTPARADVDENGCYIDIPAEECGVASLTIWDVKAVIGEDVVLETFEDGTTFVEIDFENGEPLYITLTDGSVLRGDDAYTYLGEKDQHFSFNPVIADGEDWPEEIPEPGTSQRFVCSVCSDLNAVFTVYFVASAEDEIPALQENTAYPGDPDPLSGWEEDDPEEEDPSEAPDTESETEAPPETEPDATEPDGNGDDAPEAPSTGVPAWLILAPVLMLLGLSGLLFSLRGLQRKKDH